ncbi:MAG: phosphatase [Flavobacteriales bacterium]|jgi:3-deoxy-D-manno-octulosonate 8-phosphate phosphatase (KDO 8-P phosphatase)|nr:MAG: phosphatase [Flavobacteriales bacterium]
MSLLLPFTSHGLRTTLSEPELQERLARIKAVLFDWDGVFNDGFKDAEGGSPFSEVGSMGVNLLRFALWLRNGALPKAAVITGQHNPYAERFAQREKLHGLYMGFSNKPEAFDAFLKQHDLQADEVAFFFDDVLDLPVAARCGLRVMIGSPVTAWLVGKAMARGEVDLVTGNSGGANGLREATDVMIALLGNGTEVIAHRAAYAETYQHYLEQRQRTIPEVVRHAR